MTQLAREQLAAVGRAQTMKNAFEPVREALRAVERGLEREAASRLDPFVTEMAMHLVAAGGKRVRPALVLLFARAGDPAPGAEERAAVALELLHLCTLYHDDVIDGSHQRRGVISAHRLYGERLAAFVGDHLFGRVWQLLAEAGDAVVALAGELVFATCAGQIGEMLTTHRLDVGVSSYLNNIAGKTAALFELSAAVGAHVGNLDPARIAAARVYGRSLGMAFQIIDDVLDLGGSSDSLGKRPGTDLHEGVYTLPVLLALASPDGDRFRRWLSTRALGDELVETIVAALRRDRWFDAAIVEAERFADEARAQLALFAPATTAPLHALIDLVVSRADDARRGVAA